MSNRPSRFEDWVKTHHAAVYRTAFRLVQNAEDAQDVTQEVFLQALDQEKQLEAAEDTGRVLCWMASKRALMHLRGDRRRKRREDEAAAMRRHGEAPPETDDRIGSLLNKLPEELRVALSLRFQTQLTFAQISEVIAVSEPSAHDRVKRGLAKLREWLQRGSPAALAIDIEQELREVPPPTVPPGLSERLLRLEGAAIPAVALATKVLLPACGLLLVAAAIGASSWSASRSSGPGSPAVTTADERQARANEATDELAGSRIERIPVSVPPTLLGPAFGSIPSVEFATISGRVIKPDSTPARGLRVMANSYIGSGLKVATYAGIGITDDDGAYSMRVEVHHEDGEDYRVHVRYEKVIISEERSLRVSADEQRTNFDITLENPLEETDGEYELKLTIVDESGAYLPAGSIVTLERNLHTVGDHPYPHWESGGRLDTAGSVALSGSKLGPKKIRTNVREGDEWLAYHCFLGIERGGEHFKEVTAKFVSRTSIFASWQDRKPPKFGLAGSAHELRTGNAVATPYPDVWYYRVPKITPHEFLYDFLPNKIFRGPFQSAAIADAAPETNRFQSHGLQPGRYIAMGYESTYAPTASDVVELTEDFPRADNLQLHYDVPALVEGLVRDVDGKPLANAILFVTGTGPISNQAIAGIDDLVRKSQGRAIPPEFLEDRRARPLPNPGPLRRDPRSCGRIAPRPRTNAVNLHNALSGPIAARV